MTVWTVISFYLFQMNLMFPRLLKKVVIILHFQFLLRPDGSRFVNMQFVLSTLQQHKPCCFVQLTLWLRPSPSVSFAFLWRIFTIIKKHYRGHDKQLCKVLLSCIYSAARINTKWLLFENQKDTLLDQTAELYQLEMYIKTIRKWFKALKIISTKQQLIQALLFVIH